TSVRCSRVLSRYCWTHLGGSRAPARAGSTVSHTAGRHGRVAGTGDVSEALPGQDRNISAGCFRRGRGAALSGGSRSLHATVMNSVGSSWDLGWGVVVENGVTEVRLKRL